MKPNRKDPNRLSHLLKTGFAGLLLLAATPLVASDLVITGVVDGPLTGGIPKAIEMCVLNDVADLSVYGIGSANNGGGSDGEEFTFPAVAASAGTFLYVASEGAGFSTFFGFAPSYTSGAAAINGDDAIELFMSGAVVDVFGDINVDGTGQPWEYADGWAYRADGTGPDGSTFVLPSWSFSGPNALDGETSNDTATTPFPIGAYSSCALPPVVPDVVINEVDADTAGTDVLEFVELYDGGAGNTALDGLVVVFFNGSSDTSYSAFDLDGFSTDSNGYFVLGNAGVSPAPDIVFGSNGLQNGADAVAIYQADGADFPNGTAVGTTDLVDAMVYDTNDSDDAGLLVLLNAGQPQVNEDGAGDKDFDSNQRCPNGAGGARNTDGYIQETPTPAGDNACPTVDVIINEVDADTAGSDSLEFVELYDGGVGNSPLDGLVVVFFNGNGDAVYDAFDLDGFSTDPNGYLVLGNAAVSPAPDIVFSNNGLQNGADAVALYEADGADFPNGTLVTTTGLIDAIVYDTNDSDDAGLLALLNAGQPQVNEDGAGDKDFDSNQRCPNGSGGARNTLAYVQDTPTPGDDNFCPLPFLIINEVDADTAGSDSLEFVELFDGGAGNTLLNGFVLVFFNGNGDVSYNAFDLDGLTTDANGYLVLGNAGVSPTPDVVFSNNGLQNGADAVALYGGDAADFPNGTAVTTSGLVDAMVYDTNDSDDAGLLVLLNAGQPQVNEDGAGDKDFDSNQRCPNGFGGGRNTDVYSQAAPTPAAANECAPLEIFEIQGDGFASIFEGFVVDTDDNVVTCLAPNGFFMQTPASRADGDVVTSDGIFVFTGAAPSVAVGDLVDVTGEVDEFFGFTELTSATVTVDGAGAVPAAVLFNALVPSPDPTTPSCGLFEFECYEGMLIEVVDGAVTGPNQRFGPDPIAEVHITAASSRTFREPGVEFPGLGMPPIPTWDGNPEVFELDPDKLGLPNQIIPAGSSFSAKGVLGFEFGGYELWPNELTVAAAPLPDPVRPRAAGEFTVGTLNLFRLFDDVDDPVDPDGRNDFVVSTAEYQRRRDKFAAYIVDVLDSPDILAVQEAEKIEVLQDLAADIAALDPSVSYTAYLVEGNDVGTIDVGFLVRDRVQVDAVTQLGKNETFVNPITLQDDILHDRPPLLLEGRCQLEFGSFPIAVLAVHNRSLGGIDGSQGLRVRTKRLRQAESIADKVQGLQDADPAVRLVVTGDFNAFEFTDGYVDAVSVIAGDFDPTMSSVCSETTCLGDLVEPNLDNQVLGIDGADRYSFIFGGNAQVLDHALTTQGLAAEVSGAEYGRGNADAAVDLINDDGTIVPANLPLRSSDHDGLVVYITKDEDADGVPNDLDICAGTTIPEGVPTQGLGNNRFALVDGDFVFDSGKSTVVFTVGDTGGCSCEQIIDALGLGAGQTKFGCSQSVIEAWVEMINP